MTNKFSLYQKWTSDYLNSEEIDGMCAIIIFNTYQLLSLNGIEMKNSDWFNSDTIHQLASIVADDSSDLTAFHIDFFMDLSCHSLEFSNYEKIAKKYADIQNHYDNKKISNLRNKYLYLFQSLNEPASLLTGCLLQSYRNYDLITGNALLRSIIRMGGIDNEAMTSAYSFLCMQQNPEGYFGFYMRRVFDINDLRTILCISFDCIAAILMFDNIYNKNI